MMKFCALGAVAGLAIAASASADVFSFTGTPVSIPDNTAAGVTVTTGLVGDNTQQIASLALGVRIDHTYIGDLIVRLTYTPSVGAPVSFDIMNRVGRVTSGFGDDSNPNAENLMIFTDLATTDLWAVAAGLGDSGVIPAGLYRTTGADSAAATGFDAAFAGMNGQGTWDLMISDNAGQDLGRLAMAQLAVAYAPTPGAAALLGLGGLMAGRRRR